MLHGYNNDVEYRGKEFHIQTEDLGESIGKIEAQIFHEGQILDTETVSYDSVMEGADEGENVKKKLKSLLQATHKGLYERLVSGEYDELVGLDPIDNEPDEVADPDEFEPSQDRVPDAAMQVEEEGEEAFQKFHSSKAQKHSGLDDLKGKLEDVDPDEADDEESAPEESAGEVDEALAGVGSELGALTDSDGLPEEVKPDSGGSEGDSGGDGVVESHPTVPPGSMDADDVAEVSVDEGLEESSKVTRKDPDDDSSDRSREGASATPSGIPSTGVRAWRGCEEPEESLSITSLVESYLGAGG